MEWGSPHHLVWFWTLPALGVMFALSSWRKRGLISRFGEPKLVERLVTTLDPFKRFLKRSLLFLAVCFIVVALGQPHLGKKETLVERKGTDVVIAIDVSRSMLAKDIQPTRLDKAKRQLSTLIDKLKEDRIGIVAFAGEAYIQCPLTLDKNAAKLFLGTVSPDLIPIGGTAISTAVRVGTDAFSEKDKGAKVLVLLTDGEETVGNPLEAVKRAKKEGVLIFTIGIGTSDGSTVPGESSQEAFKKDGQGRVVLSKLNEPLLKSLASTTGGRYYRSSRGELEVDSLVREIRGLAQKGLKSEWSVEYEENYQYFLAVAFALLLLEIWISERRRA